MLDILLSSLFNLSVIVPQYSGIVHNRVEAIFITDSTSDPLLPMIVGLENSDPIVPPN